MKTFAYNDWIPRIKYGAGLLQFTPAKAGAGMTTKLKDPAGGWLHFFNKDSKERQKASKYSESQNEHSEMGCSELKMAGRN